MKTYQYHTDNIIESWPVSLLGHVFPFSIECSTLTVNVVENCPVFVFVFLQIFQIFLSV